MTAIFGIKTLSNNHWKWRIVYHDFKKRLLGQILEAERKGHDTRLIGLGDIRRQGREFPLD
jgi:hypothetical protein